MKPRHRRLAWIGAGLSALGIAVALVLNAFQGNLVFFYTPSQVAAQEAPLTADDGTFETKHALAHWSSR